MESQSSFHTPSVSVQGSHNVTETENESSSDSESSMDSELNKRLTPTPRRVNIGVVVMGLTGAGKSSFILDLVHEARLDGSTFASQEAHDVQVGHSLKSCK